ncbi:N(4)-(Beta-N-acetylglucosaminyl)-L-asparaginase-like [Dermatophagoides pteronyssinus]|uniref:N(4)-(beta-N-acetylglucosaminyl)-L-asparaginase n=1 Tax=Dermatophagoides pteronyssinus TaxID=6956 RepID=A0A6P6Y0W9_DERPT|nr:N(4)-(Beta-N-acetylglucosaminyl)-L-asparaginase-like [Dermatophagoides pteronyssinus]
METSRKNVWLFWLSLMIIIRLCIGEYFDNINNTGRIPIIINTWAFDQANKAGWSLLEKNKSSLDAIVAACSECEYLQCDHTVGWGGSPDENGETTLDAMIMDGATHRIGSVAALRQVKNVIAVAKAVMEHSSHTMLVGDQATDFAIAMGFSKENLSSQWSINQFEQWKASGCQPNYWENVHPNPRNHCGPYEPLDEYEFNDDKFRYKIIDRNNHDTIGAVAIDHNGRIASGTSTNGMKHKIPGRVGDSPIPGAGSYADQDVGGAAATGDGDIILRFLSSYQAVENLRNGMDPTQAANAALGRIIRKYPKAQVGIVVLDIHGNYGAACLNIDDGFPFIVRSRSQSQPSKHLVECLSTSDFRPNSILTIRSDFKFTFWIIFYTIFYVFILNLS